ncbi:RNA methyltransferase, partial [Escherichia coli]|nr:RNA methyltransferase [Escherichia coli]
AKAVWNVDYKCKCGIILGNEANGTSDNLLSATSKIYIPMMGNAESLNVAVAGSMVMYERQRQINF